MRKAPLLLVALGCASSLAGVAILRHRAATAAPAPAAAPMAPASTCHDEDGDGYGVGCAAGPDCNDRDPSAHPKATESCNFRDDDCNGLVDDAPTCSAPKLDPSRVKVPAGSFLMGSEAGAADEKPIHAVSTQAFEIDRYEVTNARYAACVSAGKCQKPSLSSSKLRENYFGEPRFADYPVIFVSWSQANDFCTSAGGRLPTEAEWERVARGDDKRTFPWGEEAPDCSKANLGGDKRCVGDTDLVGRREAGKSPFGAYDMAGNVWEWTADWYDAGYYPSSPGIDPKGAANGTLKVMRGGCWASGQSSLRTTCRKAELPASWAPNVGFRCVYGGAK